MYKSVSKTSVNHSVYGCYKVSVVHLSSYARQRIHQLLLQGLVVSEIAHVLSTEGIKTSRQTVWRFKQQVSTHGTIQPKGKSGRPSILTPEILGLIDRAMQLNDETTAKELVLLLQNMGINISRSAILKGRHFLGWSPRGVAYCQLIREQNKEKRLQWAFHNVAASFEDVIWTDETTVQLDTHCRFCCWKKGQKPRYKPCPKHPTKVHVRAGISWRGATNVSIFEGTMNADLCINILDNFLVPFIQTIYPDGHKFMQDNDPKHTSRRSREFFEEKDINWWLTPPESPDANPIENL